MIPSSDNTTPLAITQRPDWGRGVTVTYVHATNIFTSRSGMEQRGRTRAAPRCRIRYSVTGLSAPQMRDMLRRSIIESRSICIVPFWTERARVVFDMVGDSLLLNTDPRPGFWRVGQWVLLQDATLGEQFRQVVAVSARNLSLAPDPDAILYPSGTYLYPALHCRRLSGNDPITKADLTSGSIEVEYESTGDPEP